MRAHFFIGDLTLLPTFDFAELLSAEFWARWLAIVILDLTLAGDNALVIALAVRHLPPRQQWLGRLWGSLGAVGLRIAFIGVVSSLLAIPLLKVAGGVMLLWIAVKLLTQNASPTAGHQVRHGATLREAIWIIVVADVVMSLDNVIAVAAAAHGDAFLVIFGVGLSIPIVIWASGMIARLMRRHPWVVDGGAGILGWVAAEMIETDPLVAGWIHDYGLDWLAIPFKIAVAIGVVALGRWLAARGGGPLVGQVAESTD